MEKQSVESYSAAGGKMMLLSGLNFLPDSKVVFVEKAQGKLSSAGHVYGFSVSPLDISLKRLPLPLCLRRFSSVSPPVKIERVLPESHMWCALSHYIFN